jgi:NADPH-dependent curcumin reductase CurA
MLPVYAQEHQERVQKWISEGTFKTKYTRFEGMDKVPEAFLSVFDGKSFGKSVVKLSDA